MSSEAFSFRPQDIVQNLPKQAKLFFIFFYFIIVFYFILFRCRVFSLVLMNLTISYYYILF